MRKDRISSIPEGTVDYYGKDALLRDYILGVIGDIYRKYGFEPLYTPIVENAEVFNGHHGEGEKLLFKLKDHNGENYVLKYDSTVPLARVVSMYNDIKFPYKRFQLQQSYRDDEVDKGHFREFVQCDGDIVGTNSSASDAEIIMIANDGLEKLGFNNYVIRLNHRRIIQAIANKSNMKGHENVLEIQRAIDYADKILRHGIDQIESDLRKRNTNENVIKIITDLIKISEKCNGINNTLDNINDYFDGDKDSKVGTENIREIISYLPKKTLDNCNFDITLARGADYYTGFILEAKIRGIVLGAVLGGGRYDDLVARFSDKDVPATGMAFGMERLIVAMKELNLTKDIYTDPKKIVLYADENNTERGMLLANKLREKYNVNFVLASEIPEERLEEYCKNNMTNYLCRYSNVNGENQFTVHTFGDVTNSMSMEKDLQDEYINFQNGIKPTKRIILTNNGNN